MAPAIIAASPATDWASMGVSTRALPHFANSSYVGEWGAQPLKRSWHGTP